MIVRIEGGPVGGTDLHVSDLETPVGGRYLWIEGPEPPPIPERVPVDLRALLPLSANWQAP